jgi:hypothetical protein
MGPTVVRAVKCIVLVAAAAGVMVATATPALAADGGPPPNPVGSAAYDACRLAPGANLQTCQELLVGQGSSG